MGQGRRERGEGGEWGGGGEEGGEEVFMSGDVRSKEERERESGAKEHK